jgi:hypothetical protein
MTRVANNRARRAISPQRSSPPLPVAELDGKGLSRFSDTHESKEIAPPSASEPLASHSTETVKSEKPGTKQDGDKTAMQTQKKSPQHNSVVQYHFNHRTYPSHNQVSSTAHQRGHTHNPQYSLPNVAQQPIRTRRRCASLTYASRGTAAGDRGGFPNQDKMRRTRDAGLGYGDGRG